MGVLTNRKSRMVSFRLTEDEYDILLRTCVDSGARSVSDFARTWMCDVLFQKRGTVGQPVEAKIEQLRCWLQQLDSSVKSLARMRERSSPE